MKIALIGYGKMGKTIEKIAVERQHEIVLRVGIENQADWENFNEAEADVAIEFTQPSVAVKNIKTSIDKGVPIIVGTTGWYEEYKNIEDYCKEKNGAFIAATNFSVGVNVFFALNEKLAKLLAHHDAYNAQIIETHHLEKLDSPSGTAISLAEGILNNHPSYRNWQNEANTAEGILPITSIREDDVKGTHEIIYESEIDRISIEHFAKNRNGFALGAVLAAEFIAEKTGIYTMKDVLNI